MAWDDVMSGKGCTIQGSNDTYEFHEKYLLNPVFHTVDMCV